MRSVPRFLVWPLLLFLAACWVFASSLVVLVPVSVVAAVWLLLRA
ncbi:MAG: hypothetical protein OYL41_05410 [Acidobacteriota bacterium]|nr:hypothetical protein [Acidobacteriota bacterium]